MLIGLISDTHDKLDGIDKAFHVFTSRQVSMILHAGDWTMPSTVQYISKLAKQANIPIKGVLGNNDKELEATLKTPNLYEGIEISTDKIFVFDINKKTIAIYHGEDERIINNIIQEQIYDVLITGHTHKVRRERIDSTFLVNPGSTAFSKPLSGNNALTVALFTLETFDTEIVYLPPDSPPPQTPHVPPTNVQQ